MTERTAVLRKRKHEGPGRGRLLVEAADGGPARVAEAEGYEVLEEVEDAAAARAWRGRDWIGSGT